MLCINFSDRKNTVTLVVHIKVYRAHTKNTTKLYNMCWPIHTLYPCRFPSETFSCISNWTPSICVCSRLGISTLALPVFLRVCIAYRLVLTNMFQFLFTARHTLHVEPVVSQGYVYFADHEYRGDKRTAIRRVRPDGSGLEDLALGGSGVHGFRGLAIDWIAGKNKFDHGS